MKKYQKPYSFSQDLVAKIIASIIYISLQNSLRHKLPKNVNFSLLTLSIWAPGGVGALLDRLLGVLPRGATGFGGGGVGRFVVAGVLVPTAVPRFCLAYTAGFSTLSQVNSFVSSIWMQQFAINQHLIHTCTIKMFYCMNKQILIRQTETYS